MSHQTQLPINTMLLNKEKWWEILSRFIDVLKINIFIVDEKGKIVLPPEEGKYGGQLFFEPTLRDEFYNNKDFLSKFQERERFLEYKTSLDMFCYALPLTKDDQNILGYLIVGPIIINKKLDAAQYETMASKFAMDFQEFYGIINEVRIVSNVMMHSILDLLEQVVKDNIALKIKETELSLFKEKTNLLPESLQQTINEVYSTVRIDELLATLLDVALKITNTESGSILIADQEREGRLCIKVSRGINQDIAKRTEVAFGEGICGLVAQENKPLVIKKQGENRLKHLLKRPEIEESLVLPLSNQNKVMGIMTLNSKTSQNNLEDNLENLRKLSEFIIAAF